MWATWTITHGRPGKRPGLLLQITDEGGQVSSAKIATNSLNTNGIFILTVICGLAVIGLPLVVVMVAFRGALLGFTVGYLVQRLGWKGIVFSLVTIFPFP